MRIGEICTRDVVFCTKNTTVIDAGRLMRQHHVGILVVVDERNGTRFPVGVITDRDIVIEVIAEDIAVGSVVVGDVMTAEPATVDGSENVFDTLETMRRKGIRRMPVVDQYGALIGIVALDDLLELLSEELGAIAKLISREQLREARIRPLQFGDVTTAKH